MRQLSETEIDQTISQGEFPPSVLQADERVVVVMSQSWCPQWHDMASWLDEFASKAAIYQIVYDTRPDFGRIMTFKETVFDNRQVPYLRYYYKEQLILAANWLPKRTFAALLERTSPFRI